MYENIRCNYLQNLSAFEFEKIKQLVKNDFFNPLGNNCYGDRCPHCTLNKTSPEMCRRQIVFLLTKRLISLKQTLLIISESEIQVKPLIDSIVECSKNFDLMKYRMDARLLMDEFKISNNNNSSDCYISSFYKIQVLIIENFRGETFTLEELDLFLMFIIKRNLSQSFILVLIEESIHQIDEHSMNYLQFKRLKWLISNQAHIINLSHNRNPDSLYFYDGI